MSGLVSSCYSAVTNAYDTVSDALTAKPAGYASENFIRNQRIVGVALIALGVIATTLSPLTAGASVPVGYSLAHIGCTLIGASLIQQVIGEARGCDQSKGLRVAAGICLMLAGPISLPVGLLFWHCSTMDNRYGV